MLLNTSNPGKLREFQRLFSKHGVYLKATTLDLDEIDSDPIKVVVHKVSQLEEGVWVEDTSLNIDGADVGVNVRWLVDNLDPYIGLRAEWVVLLAYRSNDTVLVYRGSVMGTIVSPHGEGGIGFDSVFMPDGSDQTLAESKPDYYNARALAVQSVFHSTVHSIERAIHEWDGPWQHAN